MVKPYRNCKIGQNQIRLRFSDRNFGWKNSPTADYGHFRNFPNQHRKRQSFDGFSASRIPLQSDRECAWRRDFHSFGLGDGLYCSFGIAGRNSVHFSRTKNQFFARHYGKIGQAKLYRKDHSHGKKHRFGGSRFG